MSEPDKVIADLPQAEIELTPEQAQEISGGASDFLLELDGIKGESMDKKPTPRPSGGITKIGPGTLV